MLYLLGVSPTTAELERKILSAYLVYVGGGNTLKMMRRWRKLGVDRVLSEAYREGVVLSGLSAGCICWFSWGHSDSMAFKRSDSWRFIRVRGMGLIETLVCPHFAGSLPAELAFAATPWLQQAREVAPFSGLRDVQIHRPYTGIPRPGPISVALGHPLRAPFSILSTDPR